MYLAVPLEPFKLAWCVFRAELTVYSHKISCVHVLHSWASGTAGWTTNHYPVAHQTKVYFVFTAICPYFSTLRVSCKINQLPICVKQSSTLSCWGTEGCTTRQLCGWTTGHKIGHLDCWLINQTSGWSTNIQLINWLGCRSGQNMYMYVQYQHCT